MMRRSILLIGLCLSPLSFARAADTNSGAKDLYFGEALYYAYQGKYVDAIPRLDIGFARYYGPGKARPDPLHFQFGHSRFAVGDFESSYRIPQRSSSALMAIYESKADRSVRNEAAYRLARIYMQDSQPEIALQTIKKITGKIPENIREDELFLRAQIYLANGKYADAVKTFRELQNATGYKGFASYNLGVALIKGKQEKQGLEQLDKAGQVSGEDEVTLSIRDKANLTLGYRMMDAKRPDVAKEYLDRVRLSGPFSNRALLGSGWADVAMGDYESALAPWSALIKRNPTDEAVQESMLGVPYAYARLNLPGKAAKLYGKALDEFVQESTRLDASIKSVREGKFLRILLHEELSQGENWAARLKSLPDKPETAYLMELMASGDFQESLRNYLDLNDLQMRLESWGESLESYEELIGLRRQYYGSLLPDFDKQFLPLDKKWRSLLERRQRLDGELMSRMDKKQHEYEYFLSDEYRSAVAAYQKHQPMDEDVKNLINTHASITSLRRAVTQSYQGYDDQIRQLKKRVTDARQKVDALKVMQGQMLETIAINELEQRRKRLQGYQAHARFALAESYERASKKQAK